jgi:hypothetical protein
MADDMEAVYIDLDEAGLPPAVEKAARTQFATMAKARDALKALAEPESARLRAAGKIPATHELAFVASKFGGAPQVVIRPMRAAKKAKPRFDLR